MFKLFSSRVAHYSRAKSRFKLPEVYLLKLSYLPANGILFENLKKFSAIILLNQKLYIACQGTKRIYHIDRTKKNQSDFDILTSKCEKIWRAPRIFLPPLPFQLHPTRISTLDSRHSYCVATEEEINLMIRLMIQEHGFHTLRSEPVQVKSAVDGYGSWGVSRRRKQRCDNDDGDDAQERLIRQYRMHLLIDDSTSNTGNEHFDPELISEYDDGGYASGGDGSDYDSGGCDAGPD